MVGFHGSSTICEMDRLLNYTKENPKIIQLTHERKKDPTSPKGGGIFNLTGLDKALGWGAFSIW